MYVLSFVVAFRSLNGPDTVVTLLFSIRCSAWTIVALRIRTTNIDRKTFFRNRLRFLKIRCSKTRGCQKSGKPLAQKNWIVPLPCLSHARHMGLNHRHSLSGCSKQWTVTRRGSTIGKPSIRNAMPTQLRLPGSVVSSGFGPCLGWPSASGSGGNGRTIVAPGEDEAPLREAA